MIPIQKVDRAVRAIRRWGSIEDNVALSAVFVYQEHAPEGIVASRPECRRRIVAIAERVREARKKRK